MYTCAFCWWCAASIIDSVQQVCDMTRTHTHCLLYCIITRDGYFGDQHNTLNNENFYREHYIKKCLGQNAKKTPPTFAYLDTNFDQFHKYSTTFVYFWHSVLSSFEQCTRRSFQHYSIDTGACVSTVHERSFDRCTTTLTWHQCLVLTEGGV